jgi:hypothetical protein
MRLPRADLALYSKVANREEPAARQAVQEVNVHGPTVTSV